METPASSRSRFRFGKHRVKELSRRWVSPLTVWIDATLRRILSDYRDIYLRYLVARYRNCQVRGLTTQGPYNLALQRIFVEPDIVAHSPHDNCAIHTTPLPESLQVGQHTLWEYLQSEADGIRNLVLIGGPGSGKTTLLQHLVLTLAAERLPHPEQIASHRLPILLYLPDHAETIQNQAGLTLAQAAQDSLTRFKRPVVPAEWVQRHLNKGECLVMLDGLDQVADPSVRAAVVEWIETQMRTYSSNRYIVTSRSCGYQGHPLHGVNVLEICPFTLDQQERFVHHWCLTNETMKARRENAGVRSAARTCAEDLLKRLDNAPALTPLAVNPLMLTLIANVHGFRSALPHSRVELYADLCNISMGAFQQARGVTLDLTPPALTPAQKQRVLRPLAYEMMVREIHAISIADAITIIAEPLKKIEARIKPEQFLKGIAIESGLLAQRENRTYAFAHLTFQEYLAAAHAHEHKLDTKLAARVGQTWWHETLRLYCAKAKDATPVLRASLLADHPTLETLGMVRECMDEARGVQPELRARMEDLLNQQVDHLHQHVEAEDPNARRATAETLLTLRLRRMARSNADQNVDNALITHAEYQLFLDDRYAQGHYHQPDHWQGHTFPVGHGHLPAVGIRPEDALAFCNWLTQRDAGHWRYRLPSVHELDEEIVQASVPSGAPISYWAASGEWVTCHRVGSAAPIRTDELFRRRLEADFARALAPARVIDADLAQDSNRTLTLALVLALDRARVLDCDLVYTLDLAHAHALDAELDRALALDLDHVHSRSIARIRSLARALAIARTRALDRTLGVDLDHTRVLALALTIVFMDLLEHIPASHSKKMQAFSDIIQRQQDAYMDLYVSLVVLEERKSGNLSAFESIRIMRERVPEISMELDFIESSGRRSAAAQAAQD